MKKTDIPGDVPKKIEDLFVANYDAMTKNTENLFLFTADHKIEHLNKDFHGPDIPPEVNDPEHLFKIASQGDIGAFATHLGLIARYGKKYPDVNYVVKLNAKTDIIPTVDQDPMSTRLWKVELINKIKENAGLKNVCGVAYTIYIGSASEYNMLKRAAKVIFEAHQAGLVTILYVYPRGKHVKNDKDQDIMAGATGIANSLGADFVKIHAPEQNGQQDPQLLKQAVNAAGNTKVICSGGPKIAESAFLEKIEQQINIGGTNGVAVGRNIFQRPLADAVAFTKKIAQVVYGK